MSTMNAFLGLLKSKEILSYELEGFVRKMAERGSGSKKIEIINDGQKL